MHAALRLPQQPGFARAQFDFARGYGAGGHFVLQAPDGVVQFAIFAALRQQEQSQAAHTLRRAFRPRGDNGQIGAGVAREVFVTREQPAIAIGARHRLDVRAQIGAPLDLGHPCRPLPDCVVPA